MGKQVRVRFSAIGWAARPVKCSARVFCRASLSASTARSTSCTFARPSNRESCTSPASFLAAARSD
eukprot:896577-Alexandrium_andersonii.AAC.1